MGCRVQRALLYPVGRPFILVGSQVERWPSGRRHSLAKGAAGLNPLASSNLALSAIFCVACPLDRTGSRAIVALTSPPFLPVAFPRMRRHLPRSSRSVANLRFGRNLVSFLACGENPRGKSLHWARRAAKLDLFGIALSSRSSADSGRGVFSDDPCESCKIVEL